MLLHAVRTGAIARIFMTAPITLLIEQGCMQQQQQQQQQRTGSFEFF